MSRAQRRGERALTHRPRGPHALTRSLLLCVLLLLSHPVRAGGPLGPDGSAIRTSRYGVDLTQTPIMAGARVTGLAGAYVAIAEGTDGDTQTPAAPAVRAPYSVDHFEVEVGLALTFPVAVTTTDFFNTGHRTVLSDATQKDFLFFTPAINAVWGNLGVGATLEIQNYNLRRSQSMAGARVDEVAAQFLVGHLQAAHRFLDGQLIFGAGLRLVDLEVQNPRAPAGEVNLFSSFGAGIEVGGLWAPRDRQFRLGASFRSAVTTNPDQGSRLAPNIQGDRVIGDPTDPLNAFWLPDRTQIPWDLNVGLAVQIGARPFNVTFIDPKGRTDVTRQALAARSAERRYRRALLLSRLRAEGALYEEAVEAADAELDAEEASDELHLQRIDRELRARLKLAYKRLPRPYALLATSLLLTGPLTDAVGVESFLQRVVARSGGRLVYSPRVGLETEIVPNWFKLRVGTYGEPTRFATSSTRIHGTVGFDVKVFPWTAFGLYDEDTEWRITTCLDAAPRYLGWGVSIGVWH